MDRIGGLFHALGPPTEFIAMNAVKPGAGFIPRTPVTTIGSRAPSTRVGRSAHLSVQASTRPQADRADPATPLKGHDWSAGLSAWMQKNQAANMSERRTRLELDPDSLALWMFRNLSMELPSPTEYGLTAAPGQVLAACLAPLAGIDPASQEFMLVAEMEKASRAPGASCLTRPVVMHLLKGLFGQEVSIRYGEHGPLPKEQDNTRVWAALGTGGKLWVSDQRWGEGGAFLFEYPEVEGQTAISYHLAPRQAISWDGHFEKFFAEKDAPVVMTWSGTEQTHSVAPWAEHTKYPAHSLLDLVSNMDFEAVNMAPARHRNHFPNRLMVNFVDHNRNRAFTLSQDRTELLCHTEAWLSGLRFEEKHKRAFGRHTPMDGAELLSVISTSIHQCPIEIHLMDLLAKLQVSPVNQTYLTRVPGGEWVMGVLEDLLQTRLVSAYSSNSIQHPLSNIQKRSIGNYGSLQIWMSATPPPPETRDMINLRQLNIHASGPIFGTTPVTLRRDFVIAADWFPRTMRVVVGDPYPLVPAGTRRLVLNMVPDLRLDHRTMTQRAFWSSLLDFNEPHTP